MHLSEIEAKWVIFAGILGCFIIGLGAGDGWDASWIAIVLGIAGMAASAAVAIDRYKGA